MTVMEIKNKNMSGYFKYDQYGFPNMEKGVTGGTNTTGFCA